MKKTVFFLSTFALLVMMSACGGSNENNAQGDANQQAAPATVQNDVNQMDLEAKALAQARFNYLTVKESGDKAARKEAKKAYRALKDEIKAKYGKERYSDEFYPKYKYELKKLRGDYNVEENEDED